MRKTMGLAAAVLLTASLGACSGDSSGDYCDALDKTKSQLDNVDFSALDQSQFTDLRTKITELHDSAPDEVADDWETLETTFNGFEDALSEAGISFDDIEALQKGEIPEGVDIQKLQEVGPKLQELAGGDEIDDATKAISDHAKDECDIDMDSGS